MTAHQHLGFYYQHDPCNHISLIKSEVCRICYPNIWGLRMTLPDRTGQRCRVVRGKMNSTLIEFPDGFRWAATKRDSGSART